MLTLAEIKKFIDADRSSTKKKLARIGQRYYDGDHDIKDYKLFYYDDDDNLVEDKYRSNIKISHPFFKELAEQLTSYMFSGLDNPIRAKQGMENSQELQKHLDTYFDDEFWAEASDLVLGAHNKGFEYLYAYINAENRLAFMCADSLGVVEVEAKLASDKQNHVLYSYIDRITSDGNKVKKIEDWTAQGISYYVQVDDGKIQDDEEVRINPRPHVVYTVRKTGKMKGRSFGYIPFWRLDNNQKQISAIKPIKNLIDDYDLHSCSLSNNLKDFDMPLYFVRGYGGDNLDKLQRNLRTKKIVSADDDGGIDVNTVDIPYQARKEKLEIDEKAIYRFGFGLNTAGLKDTAATTNIAIKSAYSLLDMKANKMELNLRRLLKDIIKVVLDEINAANKTNYQLTDIEFDFQRNIMVNEQENAQTEKTKAETKQIETTTIMNVASTLDDETVVKAICDVLDMDYDEIKDKLPKSPEDELAAVKDALNGALIDEEV